MSDLFTSAGIRCGHESFWGVPGRGTLTLNAEAESSWMIAPDLPRIKRNTDAIVIHIIRNPLKQISSLRHLDVFSEEMFKTNMFSIFKAIHAPGLLRYKGLDRYIWFNIYWNRLCAKHSDHTITLESVSKEPEKLFEALGHNIEGKTLTRKKVNSYNNVEYLELEDFSGCELFDELVQEAKVFGYDLT